MNDALGVIVAGGMGKRLGLGPKAMARLAGATLLERAALILAPCAGTIVVAAPSDLALELPSSVRVRRVDDAAGFGGPLAGVVAALESCPHERVIVLGVDFPLMRSATLRALLDRLGGHGAVVPAPRGVPQPLAAAYGPAAATVLAGALRSGERSITSSLSGLDPLLLGDEELERLPGGLECFLNLNTREDWTRAETRLSGRATLEGAA